MRRPATATAALAAMGLVGFAACANQGAPPGGPVDVRPPVLVRTEPDTFATITDLDTPVRFHFDERISENISGGLLDDAVVVSPRTGDVRVRHGRRTLTVEVEGGFRPGLLYRVTLQPVVRDMFGNQLRDPFELVFSTGGSAPPTAVAGQAWNRTTGAPVADALVQATSADSVTYVSRADQEGIYVLRYLPEGSYDVTAFEDRDRDGALDARETQGTAAALVEAGDTLLVDVALLPSDTTPAVLMTASALDSVTAVLELDDYLDFDVPVADVTVQIVGPDGPGPAVARLFHEREYTAYVETVVDSLMRLDSLDAAARAAAAPPDAGIPADSAALADTAVVDTAAPPPSPAGQATGLAGGAPSRPRPPALDGVRGGARRGGPDRPLPGRRVVALLAAPLAVGIEYEVTVSGVVNINGVPEGGGEATLLLPPPEPTPVEPALDGVPPADPPPGAAPNTTPGAGL
jgi:hypothetical protein